jgi:hypothetical protein
MSTARRTTTTAQRVAAVVVGVLVALPLALVALLATAAPAEASTYRYWTYWWGTDTGKPHSGWRFSPQGPAFHPVGDQWVLGWRFATTSTTGGAAPRQSPSFGALCPKLSTPVPGSVRVALVVDYGTTADAPAGQRPPTTTHVRLECLTIPGTPRGTDVLRAASVSVRTEKGLLCALDGYPAGECAPVLPDPTPTPTRTTPRATTSPRATASPAATTQAPTAGARSPSSAGATILSGGESAVASTAAASASASSSSSGAPVSTEPSASSDATLPGVAGAPASSEPAGAGGSPLGLVVGGIVVAAVGASAWLASRRRGQAR